MTPQDLKQIGDLIDNKLDKNNQALLPQVSKLIDEKLDNNNQRLLPHVSRLIDEKLDTRINKLETKLFKWKSEIVDAMDIFMRETQDQREFRLIGSHQINANTDRIENLEKKVFGSVKQV